jgi:peptidoglycan/xylan/chitin deacetylase (PgdA/CDA1 family)
MLLPVPPRYGFSAIADRPVYDWPGGARLAFYLALNVEQFAWGKGSGHAPHNWSNGADPRIFAWRDYGLRVGFWNIMEVLDEVGLGCCHLVNSAVCDSFPPVVERIVARGEEVVAHGRTNAERPGDYWEEDERRVIREVADTIERRHGSRPYGWMGPWISESAVTTDLLKEEGYRFVMHWPCDDQPIFLRTRSGPLLNVPYPIELNDAPAVLNRAHSAEEFARMMTDQFDTMLRLSAKWPLVCAISLHTFVFGPPFRLAQLRNALKHIAAHRDDPRVWFTSPGAIAAHALSLPPGVVPGSAG